MLALALLTGRGAAQTVAEPAAADSAGTLTSESAARIDRMMQREYPPLLRDAGVGGTAVLTFTVNADSVVDRQSISMVRADHHDFHQAAARVLRGLRFVPAELPIRVTARFTFVPSPFRATGPGDAQLARRTSGRFAILSISR